MTTLFDDAISTEKAPAEMHFDRPFLNSMRTSDCAMPLRRSPAAVGAALSEPFPRRRLPASERCEGGRRYCGSRRRHTTLCAQ